MRCSVRGTAQEIAIVDAWWGDVDSVNTEKSIGRHHDAITIPRGRHR